MRAFGLLLALSAIVPALATPLPSAARDEGSLVRRNEEAEAYRKYVFRKSEADNAKYPRVRKGPDGKYEQSQEAANQCFELNMLRQEYNPWQEYREVVLEKCGERHGYRPNPNPTNPEWRRRMQAIANKRGRSWGINTEADYNSLSDREKAEIDENIQEADGNIQRDTGFRPQRGPDRQVNGELPNTSQFSLSDFVGDFGAAGKRMFFGGDRNTGAPSTPGAQSGQRFRLTKPRF